MDIRAVAFDVNGTLVRILTELDVLRERYPLALVTDAQSAYARGELQGEAANPYDSHPATLTRGRERRPEAEIHNDVHNPGDACAAPSA